MYLLVMVKKSREATPATRESRLVAHFRFFGGAAASIRGSPMSPNAPVTPGAIYWHFKDKAELFQAVCELSQAFL